MGYPTQFEGLKMDELFEAGSKIKTMANGWLHLESTTDTPVDINTLINVGNYTVDHWVNAPAEFDEFNEIDDSPLTVVTSSQLGYTYQIAYYYASTISAYIRRYNPGNKSFNEWVLVFANSNVSSDTTPPEFNKEDTVWLDPVTHEFKSYDVQTEEWKAILPADMMDLDVYDREHKRLDFYDYVDDALKGLNPSNGEDDNEIDYESHISDKIIHPTREKVEEWRSAATTTKVEMKAAEIRDSVLRQADQQAKTFEENTELLKTATAEYDNNVTVHISDAEIHPTTTKRAEWNDKALVDHEHVNDGTVQVSAEDVDGDVPLELLPRSVHEITTVLDSLEEMLGLLPTDVQDGDFVYVRYPDPVLYIVQDQTKLGSMDAFKPYSVGAGQLAWENVKGKPVTIEGYGITDAPNREEYEAAKVELRQINIATSATLAELNEIRTLFGTRAQVTSKLASSIWTARKKVELLTTCVHGEDMLVRRLEDFVS
ncbi:MAG: hypothetical protein NC548_06530 [Lachnospiraceae bacterium]|nr:hypothetical protein [Lachnospiraceae bacterium]